MKVLIPVFIIYSFSFVTHLAMLRTQGCVQTERMPGNHHVISGAVLFELTGCPRSRIQCNLSHHDDNTVSCCHASGNQSLPFG